MNEGAARKANILVQVRLTANDMLSILVLSQISEKIYYRGSALAHLHKHTHIEARTHLCHC